MRERKYIYIYNYIYIYSCIMFNHFYLFVYNDLHPNVEFVVRLDQVSSRGFLEPEF